MTGGELCRKGRLRVGRSGPWRERGARLPQGADLVLAQRVVHVKANKLDFVHVDAAIAKDAAEGGLRRNISRRAEAGAGEAPGSRARGPGRSGPAQGKAAATRGSPLGGLALPGDGQLRQRLVDVGRQLVPAGRVGELLEANLEAADRGAARSEGGRGGGGEAVPVRRQPARPVTKRPDEEEGSQWRVGGGRVLLVAFPPAYLSLLAGFGARPVAVVTERRRRRGGVRHCHRQTKKDRGRERGDKGSGGCNACNTRPPWDGARAESLTHARTHTHAHRVWNTAHTLPTVH